MCLGPGMRGATGSVGIKGVIILPTKPVGGGAARGELTLETLTREDARQSRRA